MANPLDSLAPPSSNPLDSLPPPSADRYANLGAAGQNAIVRGALDTAAGAGGSLAQHAVNVYDLIRKIPGADKILPDSSELHKAIKDATPDNTPAHVGKFLEGATEFMVPAGEAAKLTQGAKLVTRAAAQGAVGGAVSAVQSGGNPAAIATGAALGAAGEPVADLGASFLQKVLPEILGRTTGAGATALRMARENPSPELLDAMRGNLSESEVVKNFVDAAHDVKLDRAAKYQAALAALPAGPPLDITPVRQAFDDSLQKFGVVKSAAPHGIDLDFSRSTLTDPSAQGKVLQMANDLIDWGSKPGDLTPAGVDILKRRIDDTYSASGSARAITQSTKSAARDILNQQVPGYTGMTQDYAKSSAFLEDLHRELSLDPNNPNFGATPGTATRKLVTMLKANNHYRQNVAEMLGNYVGKDLTGQIAGLNLNSYGPKGMVAPLEGLGALAAIATGHISPAAVVSAAATSPRLMGELMVAMSKVSPAVSHGTTQALQSATQEGATTALSPPSAPLSAGSTQ